MEQAPDLQVMNCPSCGGSIELRAAGYSTLYVCQYCGSEIDLTGSSAKLIAEHVEAAKALHIPLGTSGKINGVEWIAVGYLEKTDGWDAWEEFCLFNPYHGYRWLVLTESGWSLGTPILSQPASPGDDSFHYEGSRMKRCYDLATANINRAIGEFYWRVQRGDEVTSTSYVGGGKVLSCEVTRDEYNWTLEEFISSDAVAEAFGIEDTGQYPEIGDYPSPHQPNPHSDTAINFSLIAAIAFFAAAFLSIVLSFGGEDFSGEFSVSQSDTNRSVNVGTFELTGRPRPFTITTRGEPGDNNWMYVEYTLTNQETDEEIFAGQPIEYYYGRDWKEDDRKGTIKLSSVPAGKYTLTANVSLPGDETRNNTNSSWDNNNRWMETRRFWVTGRSNGTFYSNLFLLFLALFGPAIWVGFKAMSFAGSRQAGYDGADDDDDDDDW